MSDLSLLHDSRVWTSTSHDDNTLRENSARTTFPPQAVDMDLKQVHSAAPSGSQSGRAGVEAQLQAVTEAIEAGTFTRAIRLLIFRTVDSYD